MPSGGLGAYEGPGAHGRSRLLEHRPTRPEWHDGDLLWLGLLLCGVSAALVVALVWWFVV